MRLPTTLYPLAGFTFAAPVLNAPLSRDADARSPVAPASGLPSPLGAANDGRYFSTPMDDKVRILRRDVGDRARLVLSGRMADVCAALERMSRAEAISRAR